MNEHKWYKLDNIGKFYSSIANKKSQKIFRYSATVKDEINELNLQKALEDTIEIFSNFNVNLKKGIFWYYLDETKKINKVTKENLPICFNLYTNSDSFLYRVSYYKKRINFEVSHIISDGRGSIEFFKVLISNYVKYEYNVKNYVAIAPSINEKEEDSYLKYYKKSKKYKSKKEKIYHYNGKKIRNKTSYMEMHLPLKDVLNLAHKYNTTLTILLVSILIYSYKDILRNKDLGKNVIIDLPVDLRTFFKSTSSKNFFGMTSIKYNYKKRDQDLNTIITSVKKQFKTNLTAEKLSERVNKMISFEKNVFCRISPIFLKNIVIRIINKFTSNLSTTSFSNVGKVSLDKEIEKYVDEINVLTSTSDYQFTACSYLNDLSIGISSRYKYNEVIMTFCEYFASLDIKVNINVNEVK